MGGTAGESISVGDDTVRGIGLDEDTRCAHYADQRDVVAIEFACCGTVYPCVACHDAIADHDREAWPRDDRDRRAVLCGACGDRLTIATYLDALEGAGDGGTTVACPRCDAGFNPGCLDHVDEYFSR